MTSTTEERLGTSRDPQGPRATPARDVPVPAGFDMTRYLSGLGANLAGQANVIMQLARPAVGYGVMNSRVLDGAYTEHPLKRTRTTFTYIAVAMLGTDEDRTAYRRAVTGQHAQVVSRDDEPVSYRAMDPQLQLWVAACLYYGTADLVERLRGPLEESEKDALYAHCARFGTTLQVPREAWPVDRAAFDRYWEESLDEVHVDAAVREYLVGLTTATMLPRPVARVLAPFNVFMTCGFLPERFRTEMGLPWTEADQRRFDRVVRRLGLLERRLPVPARIFPFNLLLVDTRVRRRRGRRLV